MWVYFSMFHWSIFHSYHQYHIVLISIAQSKSSSESPITLLFFFKAILAKYFRSFAFPCKFQIEIYQKPAEIFVKTSGRVAVWARCWDVKGIWSVENRKKILFSASKLTYEGQSSALSCNSKQNSSVRWNACLVMQVAGYAGESKNFISTWSMQAKYRYNSGDRLPIYYQVPECILCLILLKNIQQIPEQ